MNILERYNYIIIDIDTINIEESHIIIGKEEIDIILEAIKNKRKIYIKSKKINIRQEIEYRIYDAIIEIKDIIYIREYKGEFNRINYSIDMLYIIYCKDRGNNNKDKEIISKCINISKRYIEYIYKERRRIYEEGKDIYINRKYIERDKNRKI